MTITLTVGQIIFLVVGLFELGLLGMAVRELYLNRSQSIFFDALPLIIVGFIMLFTFVLYGGIYIW